jgi:hypothetical protein
VGVGLELEGQRHDRGQERADRDERGEFLHESSCLGLLGPGCGGSPESLKGTPSQRKTSREEITFNISLIFLKSIKISTYYVKL